MHPVTDTPAVWVVDDDPDDQFLFQTVFGELTPSLAVKALGDGSELLACLKDAALLPKLVLLDLNMPRMNGFEALHQIRAFPAFKTLPIVVLTTSASADDKAKALRLGANRFISKPTDIREIALLARHLVQEWNIS